MYDAQCVDYESERENQTEQSHDNQRHVEVGVGRAETFALDPLGCRCGQSQQERPHCQKCHYAAYQSSPRWRYFKNPWEEISGRYENQGYQYAGIKQYAPHVALKHRSPECACLAFGSGLVGVTFDEKVQFLRKMLFYDIIYRVGHLDKVGGGEGGDYRHRHHNRIDGAFEHSERHTE